MAGCGTALERIAIAAVRQAYRGEPVEVSRHDYHGGVRAALDRAIRHLAGQGDDERADRILGELYRLDSLYGASPIERPT